MISNRLPAFSRLLATRRPLAMALSAMVIAGTAQADEDIFFSDLPIVASVSRLPQKLSEAPAAVTVIDRELIRASGARNLADLLRLVPGFQVTSPNQDAAIVAYHGMGNEEYTPRVQVLIDGRSQYSPLFKSGVNWNLLPVVLENIERIEVIRGSNTVAYGSNAFLGVVNIITQDSSQTRGWMVSANHGSASVRDETLRWGGKVGAADVRFTYRQQGDGGFRKIAAGDPVQWSDPHDSRHATVVDLRADIPLSDRDELQISLSQAADISQYGRVGNLSDPFRDLSQSSTSFGTEWRRIIAADEEFKLRFSHTEDWASGLFQERVSFTGTSGSSITPYYYPNNPGGRSVVSELEMQHILSPWQKTRLLWGLAGKTSAVSSQYQYASTDWKQRSSYRAFGNLEWRPATEWLFNAGSSLEHDSLSGLIFDPRVSVSYHLTPDHTLRFIASQAHRTPSLYEALGDIQKTPAGSTTPIDRIFLAVPGLKPERIDTLELGYLGELKSARASIDVRVFHERVPNRIQIVPLPLSAATPDDKESNYLRNLAINNSIYPFGRADGALNLEQVVIKGYEYQLRWQPLDGTRLLYNNALVVIDAGLTDESVVADDALGGNVAKISRQTRESAPTRAQSAMLIQQLPYNVQSSVMYYKSDAISWKRNSYSRAYERVDWRLAKPFKVGTSRAEIAYTAQLANHPQDGRNTTRVANEVHWVSLRLEF